MPRSSTPLSLRTCGSSVMAGEWRTATVSELQRDGILLVEDGNHGEYRPRPDEFVDAGVAFIRAADMDAGLVHFGSASRISGPARTRITKGIGAPGDILLSHKGTVGKVALVPYDAPSFVCSPQTTFWRTLNTKVLDRRYLFAFLRSPGFHAQLATRAGETDMAPYVSLTSQRGLTVVVPPLESQRGVARILGALDDKIELNQRMNETLEAMARTLFKSWFVDFDPVRAKADGRPTNLSQPFAGLFPAAFENSELGPIPEGWSAQSLPGLSSIYSGGTPSKGIDNYWNGDLPWISPKVMTSIHVDQSEEMVTAAAVGNGTRRVPRDSVLIMVRGMGLHQGVRIAQAQRDVTFNQDVKACVPKSGDGTFLLFALLDASAYLFSKVQASGHGTGVLPTDILEGLSFAIPPAGVRDELTKPLANLNARMASNIRASQTLTALRDTLLPKLISGELRVKAAEKIVEAVA